MIDGRKDNDLREDSRRKCRVLGVWRGELRNGNGCSAGRREAGGERWTGRWERMRNDGQGEGRRGGAGRGAVAKRLFTTDCAGDHRFSINNLSFKITLCCSVPLCGEFRHTPYRPCSASFFTFFVPGSAVGGQVEFEVCGQRVSPFPAAGSMKFVMSFLKRLCATLCYSVAKRVSTQPLWGK